jgi:MoxR-like ATPase
MDKRIERVYRTRTLTAEEAARANTIRRKVMEEFPPLATAHKPRLDSISEELREAIRASDRSVRQIADDAGLSDELLSRFLSGERDIRMATADKLAETLGLKLIAGSGRQ